MKHADKKYLYKFVVDGQWINDHEGPQEDDGHNNVNNVLHPEHIKRAPSTLSSAAPESTTAALAGGVPLSNATHSTAPGAFPETPANEAQPSFGVAPIPASEGVGNPAHEGATAKTVESSATTSKEAYDNAGSSDFPGDGTNFSVNPIPASEGIGNPVSTKPGEGLPENVKSANTVDSTVTTSKEDYEKAGSYGLPAAGAAIGGALAAGAAALGFGTKEENKKNLIPESSLPMGDAAGSGGDAGPHIQSAGPQSTTAALAGAVPLEKDRAAGQANLSSAAPESTTAALAGSVPAVDTKAADSVPEAVKESLAESGQSAEAAASPDAVKDKSALEKELLSKTTTVEESTGESAKEAIAGQSSHGGLAAAVPDTVEKSMEKAGAAPEAAADSSVVAEKTAVERELAGKVSKTDATGEPAPVVSAETSAVAPAATGTAAAAGAAAVGAAGIGAAGIGAAGIASADKTVPGASNHAAAAISDGADDGEQVEAPKHTTTTERTEADETEYAPPPTSSTAPGVSSGAAAAVSDGADDGLADEPAVKMMNQNETGEVAAVDGAKDEKPTETATDAAKPVAADTTTTSTPAATKPKEETKSTAPTSATSTPTKKPAETPESSPAGKDKKKKHRISSFFKKILN